MYVLDSAIHALHVCVHLWFVTFFPMFCKHFWLHRAIHGLHITLSPCLDIYHITSSLGHCRPMHWISRPFEACEFHWKSEACYRSWTKRFIACLRGMFCCIRNQSKWHISSTCNSRGATWFTSNIKSNLVALFVALFLPSCAMVFSLLTSFTFNREMAGMQITGPIPTIISTLRTLRELWVIKKTLKNTP